MLNEFSRTQLLLGYEAMRQLAESKIAVFGIGGVGSFAAEALARSGIGALALFDNDCVCLTNINRQLIATHQTIGQKKVRVMSERILDINPGCVVETHECFYSAENAGQFDLSQYDYVVDAIDTISSKLELIERAKKAGVAIISCMGAGNKLDPTRFEVADIYETSVCPLARVLRRELRARGIRSLKVVYSREEPQILRNKEETSCEFNGLDEQKIFQECNIRRQIPGSVAFVPSVAGLILASEVVRGLTGR